MNTAQAHFNRMKDEGLSDMDAFLEAFDYAQKAGLSPKMADSGTHAEFDSFTCGFAPELIERLRSRFEFTD